MKSEVCLGNKRLHVCDEVVYWMETLKGQSVGEFPKERKPFTNSDTNDIQVSATVILPLIKLASVSPLSRAPMFIYKGPYPNLTLLKFTVLVNEVKLGNYVA